MVYTGEDGQSHFEGLESPDEENFRRALKAGEALIFRPDNIEGWRNPPRRQYVILLVGATGVEIGGGTKKILRPGDMGLMEYMTGPGPGPTTD